MTPKADDIVKEALAAPQGHTGSLCWRQKLKGRPLEVIEALEAHMANGVELSSSTIAAALRKAGEPKGDNVIRRHYSQRACRCFQ